MPVSKQHKRNLKKHLAVIAKARQLAKARLDADKNEEKL